MLGGVSLLLKLLTFYSNSVPITTITMYISPAGMILVNTFEETFGDINGEGVWRKFSKRASNINRNVVALASFNGDFTVVCHLLFHLCFYYN
jgi:membrane-bound ClpP family serine protease